jgi:hypothetical protein
VSRVHAGRLRPGPAIYRIVRDPKLASDLVVMAAGIVWFWRARSNERCFAQGGASVPLRPGCRVGCSGLGSLVEPGDKFRFVESRRPVPAACRSGAPDRCQPPDRGAVLSLGAAVARTVTRIAEIDLVHRRPVQRLRSPRGCWAWDWSCCSVRGGSGLALVGSLLGTLLRMSWACRSTSLVTSCWAMPKRKA